ncbi:hypothetical protein BC940DRAFT_287951 [Gongronella butleri]|nr:hypothetical protein BC940DRAFT_287951 [Gongronella butleri]
MAIFTDGAFRSVSIEPFNRVLEFLGPINLAHPNSPLKLKGDVRLDVAKAVKVHKMTLKFEGWTHAVHHSSIEKVDLECVIAPEQKTTLLPTTTSLAAGQVILPWELEIPNIYPCSVMIKRLMIQYRLEVKIKLRYKTLRVRADQPIIIKRHLLPSVYLAPAVPPKTHTNTISTKFHYEIDCPRVVCVTQGDFPISIKLVSIGSQKRVLSIRTQIIQFELYRCSVSKTDTDVTKGEWALTQHHHQEQHQSSQANGGRSNALSARFIKRTPPALIHALDESETISAHQRVLLRHRLHDYLILDLKSPLATIYHQLEITLQFGSKFEDIRARLPVSLISAAHGLVVPPTAASSGSSASTTTTGSATAVPAMPLYPFEQLPDSITPLCVTDESYLDMHGTTTILTTTNMDTATAPPLSPRPPSSRYSNNSNSNTTSSTATTTTGPSSSQDDDALHHPMLTAAAAAATASRSFVSSRRPVHHHERPQSSASYTSRTIDESDLLAPAPARPRRASSASTRVQDDCLSYEESTTSSGSGSGSGSGNYMSFNPNLQPDHSFVDASSLASRPMSPTFATAPNLPSSTNLQPQAATGALPEESFLPSSASVFSTDDLQSLSSSVHHPWHRYAAAMQYAQGYVNHGQADAAHQQVLRRRMSGLSVAQSSIVDPDDYILELIDNLQADHEFQEGHARALEDHYKHADLPPLPPSLPVKPVKQPLPPTNTYNRRQTPTPTPTTNPIDTILAPTSSRRLLPDDIVLAAATIDDMHLSDDDDDTQTDTRPNPTSLLPPPPPRRPSAHQLQPPQQQHNDENDDDDAVCLCPKHGVPIR